MKLFRFVILGSFLAFISVACMQAHDVLLEVKGAYFMSADQTFKSVFDNGCGEFGLELTSKFFGDVYGFLSADFFNKTGETATFDTPSKFQSTNLAVGLKYFLPLDFDHVDFYIGLGAQPTYLRTVDSSPFLSDETTTAWKLGGIAKFGAIVDITHSLFFDFFIDYSFVHFHFNSSPTAPVQQHDAILNGALFGAGFGYRFN